VKLWGFDIPIIRNGIDHTKKAFHHYYTGKGKPMVLGNQTIKALIKSNDFQLKHKRIISGLTTRLTGNFPVDLTYTSYAVSHVGRTNVDYSIKCKHGTCTVTYDFFVKDGFWDVNAAAERTIGKIPWAARYKADGIGPNLEVFGGTPYRYIPVRITYTFRNSSYQKL
jgi:hypothetical protein